MAKFKFVIDKQGKVSMEGQGFQGPVCQERMRRFLETARLGTVVSEQPTAEYYEQEQTNNLELEQ